MKTDMPVTAFCSVIICELQTTDEKLAWFWAAAICKKKLFKKKKHNLGEYQLLTEQKEYNRANTDLNHSKSLQKTPQCISITERVCRNIHNQYISKLLYESLPQHI